MDSTNGNGQDASAAQLAELLQEIRGMRKDLTERIDRTNARLDGVGAEVKGVRAEVQELRAEVQDVRADVKGVRGEVVAARDEAREYSVEIMGDTREIREALRLPTKAKKTGT